MSARGSGLPFEEINRIALSNIQSLLREWFPRGKVEGHEYRIGSINGEAGSSFGVNLTTGRWGEFNGRELRGGDLISLYAAKFTHGDQGAAARKLAERFGIKIGPTDKPKNRPPLGPPIKPSPYDYQDANGTVIFQVTRHAPIPGEDKPFRQRRPNGKGGWIWNLDGVERVLYRLPQLLAAPNATMRYLCEGEKDADRLIEAGLVATTNAMGAGNFKPEQARYLEGCDVALLVDNDQAGEKRAVYVPPLLLAGGARSVRVIRLPGLGEGEDVSDWLDAGGTVGELERLADEAPEYRPPPQSKQRGIRALRIRYGHSPNFHFIAQPADLLHDGGDKADLIKAAQDHRAELIVLDTLSRLLAGGDENSPQDMGTFVLNVSELRHATGAHIAIVHHGTKSSNGSNPRGHSCLTGADDALIEVLKLDDGSRQATVIHAKDDADGMRWGFKLELVELGRDDDGDPITTLLTCEMLQAPPVAPQRERLSDNLQIGLKTLHEAMKTHGVIVNIGDGATDRAAVPEADWRTWFYREGKPGESPDTKQKAFRRIVDGLQARSLIGSQDGFIWPVMGRGS